MYLLILQNRNLDYFKEHKIICIKKQLRQCDGLFSQFLLNYRNHTVNYHVTVVCFYNIIVWKQFMRQQKREYTAENGLITNNKPTKAYIIAHCTLKSLPFKIWGIHAVWIEVGCFKPTVLHCVEIQSWSPRSKNPFTLSMLFVYFLRRL